MYNFCARCVCVLSLFAALCAQVPSPKQLLGHDIGEDHYLCNYTDLVRYFRAVDVASDRVALREIGKTSYGQSMVMAVITSPQNHARLDELRATSQQILFARGVDAVAAKVLAQSGKALVWIDAGLHATEAIAGQNIIELVWQMASRDDEEVRRILDAVVLLVCPVNPDGLELVANAYMATGKMDTPVLYQRYIGHDNNRDFYVCNQIEAENINRVFYRDWCPQIVYNHHQPAPSGTIIFTPPFRDPFNYYADANVIRGIEVVSAHMNARFAREQKPGVISRSGAPYSGWWNGGLRSTCYFHNIIGILTESFGHPDPTKLTQTLDRRLPYGDYPDPVPTQVWHARQTIEYLQTANFAILDYAAKNREALLLGSWLMGNRAIAHGSQDYWTPTPKLVAAAKARGDDSPFADPALRDPRAYVLRLDQRDAAAMVRLVRALQKNGIEVLRATEPFVVGGVTALAGSYVISCAQAFRAHVLDMFEPQYHPDDMRDGKPVPPYDAAGWTLSMQMGVEVIRVFEELRGPFARLDELAPFGSMPVDATAGGWKIDPANSHAITAVNRLLKAKVGVECLSGGAFYVPNTGAARCAAMVAAVADLGVHAEPFVIMTDEVRPSLQQPRLCLYDQFGGTMPTGWDQWTMLQFEFPVQQVFGDRIGRGDLGKDFDALVFHAGIPGERDLNRSAQAIAQSPENLVKLQQALPPFEDWSNLAARATPLNADSALPALRQFVEQGGTLIALGSECEKVIRHWALPIKVGVFVSDAKASGGERKAQREEFYIPGSLVALDVDLQHPLAAGMEQHPAAMFIASTPVFEVTGEGVQVLARYRARDTLVSGWAIGEEHLAGKAAIVTAQVGEGRIVLFGVDATYRGQPVGTFKPFFQAILRSTMKIR